MSRVAEPDGTGIKQEETTQDDWRWWRGGGTEEIEERLQHAGVAGEDFLRGVGGVHWRRMRMRPPSQRARCVVGSGVGLRHLAEDSWRSSRKSTRMPARMRCRWYSRSSTSRVGDVWDAAESLQR